MRVYVCAMQVAGDYRREQREARQRQAEARDIERCMERMLSQVVAKERMIDHEVRLVSTLTARESQCCFRADMVGISLSKGMMMLMMMMYVLYCVHRPC